MRGFHRTVTPAPSDSASRGNETPPPPTQAAGQGPEPDETATTGRHEETPERETETSEVREAPTATPAPEATAVPPARTPETALWAVPIPRRLRVTHNQGDGFTVRWDVVPGAEKYRVEYLTGRQDGWQTADESITGTEYTVRGIACNIPYRTRVSAYGNGKDYQSGWGSATTPAESRTGICTNLVITGEPYHFTLFDHKPEGYSLTRITVNNPTGNQELEYKITDGNQDEIFAIDKNTGEITVDGNLKSSSRRWVSLQVAVTDSKGRSDRTQVTIDLRESHTPTVWDFSVQEAGRDTVTLSWPPLPGLVSYRVAYRPSGWGDPETSSDSITGTSHTVTGLDCERQYEFTIVGMGDGDIYPRTWGPDTSLSQATGDCERPFFELGSYYFTVGEDVEPGTIVGVVTAWDTTPGETLTYYLLAEAGPSRFGIDTFTGQIAVTEELTAGNTYEFIVEVTDIHHQQDTATVTIQVVGSG